MTVSRLSRGERGELLDIFIARREWTHVYFALRPKLVNEADNHLIGLAVAGAVGFVVSRNRRDSKHYIGIAAPARRAHPCRRSPSVAPMPMAM